MAEVETKKYLSMENAKALWDAAADVYVAKENGKGLSENDFTDADKEKLDDLVPLTNEEIDEIVSQINNPTP